MTNDRGEARQSSRYDAEATPRNTAAERTVAQVAPSLLPRVQDGGGAIYGSDHDSAQDDGYANSAETASGDPDIAGHHEDSPSETSTSALDDETLQFTASLASLFEEDARHERSLGCGEIGSTAHATASWDPYLP